MEKNIHGGHRERLRSKLGSGTLERHELLEALLFYSIPRRNTNDTAHELINEFGSFNAVFNAEKDELLKVDGIGNNSADLIKLISEIIAAYNIPPENNRKVYNLRKITDYLIKLYAGETEEKLCLMLFNNSMNLVDYKMFSSGHAGHVSADFHEIAKAIFAKREATRILIAHNHPSGSAVPSMADIETANQMYSFFTSAGIPMLEFLIIAGNDYSTVLQKIRGELHGLDSDFARKFYF